MMCLINKLCELRNATTIIILYISNKNKNRMEMRINLDQLFGSSKAEDNLHDASIDSYPTEQESSLSYEYKYKLNNDIFDTSATQSQHTPHIAEPSVSSSSMGGGFHFQGKLPGERLYYQSLNTNARKKQELERLKLEKIMEEKKEITFRPQINKNSQKIATQKLKKDLIPKKKTQQPNTSTRTRQEQEEAMQCTFKPKLVSKPMSRATGPKEQVFDHLFNEHKLKKYKQKLKTEEDANESKKLQKKLSKQQFQKFLQRSNEFMSKVQKKNQMVIVASSKYDLDTGNKLFAPKTTTNANRGAITPNSGRSSGSNLNYFKKSSQTAKKPTNNNSSSKQPQNTKQNASKFESMSDSSSLFNKYQQYENDDEESGSNVDNIRRLLQNKKKPVTQIGQPAHENFEEQSSPVKKLEGQSLHESIKQEVDEENYEGEIYESDHDEIEDDDVHNMVGEGFPEKSDNQQEDNGVEEGEVGVEGVAGGGEGVDDIVF